MGIYLFINLFLEIDDEKERIKMIYDNLIIVFKKELEKLNNFINEMNEELNSQTLKLNLTVEKAENSFQQYELLYYEIGTLKKNLLEKGKENTKENLDKISKLKKPNEAIYLLMNMFVKIISKEINNNLSWDIIQKNLSYENLSFYLLSLSKSVNVEMSKKDLDEAMPFLVNYEKLKLPIKELGDISGKQKNSGISSLKSDFCEIAQSNEFGKELKSLLGSSNFFPCNSILI